MAARDRYDIKFQCKECGETGTINISEDDYPFMKNPHREVDNTIGNISASMRGDFEVIVTCGNCKKKSILFRQATA